MSKRYACRRVVRRIKALRAAGVNPAKVADVWLDRRVGLPGLRGFFDDEKALAFAPVLVVASRKD